MKFSSHQHYQRQTVNSVGISQSDIRGIEQLYEALSPIKFYEMVNISAIHQFIPTYDFIDINMIISKAFPAFEETIGSEAFSKVKRFFGIGCTAKKHSLKQVEIDRYINQMRTIENAQYYISGYAELVKLLAAKLSGAPKGMTDIEKAKIVRAYFNIYCGYYYFIEDYCYIDYAHTTIDITNAQIEKVNKMPYGPEEMILLYISKLHHYPDGEIIYDCVFTTISSLSKRLQKEFLDIAELAIKDNRFANINSASSFQSFTSLRKFKLKLHDEPGCIPLELFCTHGSVTKLDFCDIYLMYKSLTTHEFASFPKVTLPIKKIEGSRIYDTTRECYEILPEFYIGGPAEKERILAFVEYLMSHGVSMQREIDFDGSKIDAQTCNVQTYFTAISFAKECGYLTDDSTATEDFNTAQKIINMDTSKALKRFYSKTICADELKDLLGIDYHVEEEVFGIQRPLSATEIFIDIGREIHILNDDETSSVDSDLISAVLEGSEEILQEYHRKEVPLDKCLKSIGFYHAFGRMFYFLSEVDIDLIEKNLLEIKSKSRTRNSVDKKYIMLIKLYCYLRENDIPCGPKNKVPKGTSALKVKNLRNLI